MIPKVIYKIWISDKSEPEYYKKYTDTWKKFMPDYEIKEITIDNMFRNQIIEKLIEQKKYVVISNYLRVYYTYTFGGIYMDNDVEVVKSFDELLNDNPLIGWEDKSFLNPATMGCESGNQFMGECLNFLNGYDYSLSEPELETAPRMANRFKASIPNIRSITTFCPYHYTQSFSPDCIKEDTYAIHHWGGSWTDKPKQL